MGKTKEERQKDAIDRLGQEKLNNDGERMKIVEYINSHKIIVEFLDEFHHQVESEWQYFQKGCIVNPRHKMRLGAMKLNNDGCEMKVVEYNNHNDIVVEFQDKHRARVHTQWYNFENGRTKNPYFPSVYGIGVVGNKYATQTKEYSVWRQILGRCFVEKTKEKSPTYIDSSCCDEWLNYETFYDWIHQQENFTELKKDNDWFIDKDIIKKGNKIYSPEYCCLVPRRVNNLFTKRERCRGQYPIGVTKDKRCVNSFVATCANIDSPKNRVHIGTYHSSTDAFYAYKQYKENLIKDVANKEYACGRITKRCYNAMTNYKVELTD